MPTNIFSSGWASIGAHIVLGNAFQVLIVYQLQLVPDVNKDSIGKEREKER